MRHRRRRTPRRAGRRRAGVGRERACRRRRPREFAAATVYALKDAARSADRARPQTAQASRRAARATRRRRRRGRRATAGASLAIRLASLSKPTEAMPTNARSCGPSATDTTPRSTAPAKPAAITALAASGRRECRARARGRCRARPAHTHQGAGEMRSTRRRARRSCPSPLSATTISPASAASRASARACSRSRVLDAAHLQTVVAQRALGSGGEAPRLAPAGGRG